MKQIVIVINKLNPSAAASLRKLKGEGLDISVVVLRDIRVAPKDQSNLELGNLSVLELETDFFDDSRLSADLAPYREVLIGVVSRGESSIQYLAKLTDICYNWGLPLPTSEALKIATDKQLMRQSFMKHCPEVTPSFLRVRDDSEETMRLIDKQVGYPLIIKPANLASSLLIQKCDTPEQTRTAVKNALQTISRLYDDSGRYEEPVLIVEQMLEGGLYSVDAYVSSDGEINYCPAVEYVTGQSIGVDDFFLYRRSAPIFLEGAKWDACKLAVGRGIEAIGLRSTVAHVELCNTSDGWKIIEIGPRVGRYRIEMYKEIYGIDHSNNDIKVRLGMKPEIPVEAKAYCSVYSIYPTQEGVLGRISNLDALSNLPSLVYARRLVEDGSEVRHAKHGGIALAEMILAHIDKDQFDKDCTWLEDNVKAVVT